jgi:hypothetical protein
VRQQQRILTVQAGRQLWPFLADRATPVRAAEVRQRLDTAPYPCDDGDRHRRMMAIFFYNLANILF